MRFTATGPNIPNELIDAQKRGELLFFCGAGVSVPAGLPSFEKLTKNVADKLHALDDKESEISNLLFNKQFDRTFTALKRTYGDEIVDSILLNELKLPQNPLLDNHENLLKLSINEENEPFIITTNFDLLFEKVNKEIRSFVPPYLPDLQSKESLSGIVYLHGKWINPKKNKPNNLIISSQNFGRAYLSHGWATRFLSNLLTRRTVVLIGYSGDDTLVRYLLEGLNSEGANANSIYAFERGEQGYIETKWSQLGATGISYPDHNDLWDTVAEWAKYAGDEQKWDRYINQLAQQSPKNLESFERGIITNYISTAEGAYKFMGLKPTPSSEWIYVFDKKIRLGQVEEIENTSGEKLLIDPIDLYGTDIDPSRSELDSLKENLKDKVGKDYISIFSDEHGVTLTEGLSNIHYENLWNVQSRIHALAIWFSKVAEQPAAIWWAQKQTNLHPAIIDQIKKRILDNPEVFLDRDLNFWIQNITTHVDKKKFSNQHEWYAIKKVLEKDQNPLLDLYFTYLKDVLSPILSMQPECNLEKTYIPTRTNEQYLFSKFDIDFPKYGSDNIEIHSENLQVVIKIISEKFIQYINLVNNLGDESTKYFFHNFYFPPINFDNPLKPQRNVYKKIGNLILWMCDLLKKLSIFNEELLIEVVKEWPNNDDLIFNRLKLFVWANSKSIDKLYINKDIKCLSNNFFWNRLIESDIMSFISNQWDNLDEDSRLLIEHKIIDYRQKSDHETCESYTDDKNYQVGRLLHKINQTKLGLSNYAYKEFTKIKSSDNWQENYAEQESLVAGVQSGLVSTNTSIEELDAIKDSTKFFEKVELLESDRSILFERKKPFIGFVTDNLSEALNKLLEELEKDNKREKYWIQFFDNVSSEVNQKQLCLIGEAILKLPQDIINSCRFTLTRFIEERLINACLNKKDLFWGVWDYIFNTLNLLGSEATSSAFGDSFESGRKVKKSRKTLEHAMNSPIGQLVDAIFKTYNTWNLKPHEFKSEVLWRLEIALQSKGEGSHHAISMITRNFNFLYENYETWSKYHLVPIFNPNNKNGEAAWDSFFNIRYKPSNRAILILKPFFIDLFKNELKWSKNERFKNHLASFLIKCCYWSYPKQKLFTNLEVRKILRSFDSDMLSHCLWILSDIVRKEKTWLSFGRFFFKNIWPKENFCQTSKTSKRLLDLAIDTSEYFSDIVKNIEPYLRNIEPSSLFLYQLTNDEDKHLLTEKYPQEVLLLLDKVIGQRVESYDNSLSKILEKIVREKPVLKNSIAWQRLYKLSISVF